MKHPKPEHLETHIAVKSLVIETMGDLIDFLTACVKEDPRGKDVARVTAVHIDNRYVGAELRQFEDKTRELALKGVS